MIKDNLAWLQLYIWTSHLCFGVWCKLHGWFCYIAAECFEPDSHERCTSSLFPTMLYVIPCRKPFWSRWRHGILVILQVLFIYNSKVEYSFCGATSSSESCCFLSSDLLRLWFQSVHARFHHDFTGVTYEAICSIVLALLVVSFLRNCHYQLLCPWCYHISLQQDIINRRMAHSVGHTIVLLYLAADWCQYTNNAITPACTSSAG